MAAVDWQKVYDIAKDFGLPLVTFGLGMVVEHARHRRSEEKSDRQRAEEADAAKAQAREDRISRVVDAYMKGAQNSRILGEDGALEAGVLDLNDWSEVRDFVQRATHRVTRGGDEPIPGGRRSRVKDEQLIAYFQTWRKARLEKGGSFDVDKLIAELPPVTSPSKTQDA